MSNDIPPFPIGSGWSFLGKSSSVIVMRVNRAGTILATNRHATTLIGEPLVGRPWHTILQDFDGNMTLAELLGETRQPQLLNTITTLGLSQTIEVTVEPTDEDYFLFGEVNAAQQARHGREVQELNQELNNLTRRLALMNAELEQHRYHLEELVVSRTIALAKANEAAEVIHLISVERMRTDAEARMQARKLEAVGTLAAGISHDFNNILGCIVGFTEMVGDKLAEGSEGKQNTQQILTASFRARDLIARLLAFSSKSPSPPVLMDVVAQARDAFAMLRATIRPSVLLSFRNSMDSVNAIVLADPTQIQQIVMNLCINAADAIDKHGTISICIAPSAKITGVPPELVDGICLTVTDNGSGMTPEVMERVFDPFFTTKAPSKGSGLGLSVVYGIVTGMGGVIKVRSRFGCSKTGTRFRVFLPQAKQVDGLPKMELF